MRRLTTALVVACALATSMFVYAAPADASVAQGFIAGAGTVTDDFGDEGTLSTTSHANSGATGLWQWILWADGAKYGTHTYTTADVDFGFGPNTQSATKYWQSKHGLSQTGSVALSTWDKAQVNLKLVETDSEDTIVQYHGTAHNIDFERLTERSGEYLVYTSDCYNDAWNMSTDYNTIDWDDAACD